MTKRKLVLESQFQNSVREAAEAYGWKVMLTYRSKHSPRGEPDLRLVKPPRVIFAELKIEDAPVTPDQGYVIQLLSECPGVEVYVWRWPDDWERLYRTLEGQSEWPK